MSTTYCLNSTSIIRVLYPMHDSSIYIYLTSLSKMLFELTGRSPACGKRSLRGHRHARAARLSGRRGHPATAAAESAAPS